jgi:hypothetical protein
MPSTPPSRALWLWHSEKIQDPAEVSSLLSFATTHSITAIHALISRDIPNPVFASFIAQCTQRNISVQALIGNPQWLLNRGSPTLDSSLDWLVAYQTNATQDSRFSAIHMDIEPHALSSWNTDKPSLIAALQRIVIRVKALGDSLGMQTGADVMWWAHTVSVSSGEALGAWMLATLDFVVFMTYRTTVDEIMDLAKMALEAGDQARKPVWLAVETNPVADEAELISYAGLSQQRLFADLACVAARAALHDSFAGVVVHDYSGVVGMAPGEKGEVGGKC